MKTKSSAEITLKTLFSSFFIVHCSLLIVHCSFAQPTSPMLTLNNPMHTGMINRISTDVQGKYLMTASDDKTAKLWDALTGELIRTYRIPIDKGNEGKLYACAISPDGATVALGGYTGYDWFQQVSIYIFNTRTGAMIRRIPGLPNVINDLEFSFDGSYLAVSLGESNGIRIYSTGNWSLLKSLTGYDKASNNICFDRTGRLATVCYDGEVRLYDASFNLIIQTDKLAGSQPFSIDFSPDGSKLAVGYSNSPVVEVLDGKNLHLLYRPDNTGANSVETKINKVCFSLDGIYLYGGGSYIKYNNGAWWFQIRRWRDAGKGSYTDMDACQNGVMDIKPLPDDDMLFGGAYPDFGRIGTTGKKLFYKQAETNSYATKDKSHFKTDYTGNSIAFKSYGKEPMYFSVISKSLSTYTDFAGEELYKDQSGNLTITDWNGNTSPKLNGKNLSFLKQYEISRCVDISKDCSNIIFGADWDVFCLNNAGDKQWEIAVPEMVFAVNITGNDKTVVVAFGDGTIRWFRMRDGKELLALYANPDNKRWVLWTPSGYYDCSAGAEDLIGWHINNGADREASYYPASKFRNTYYRPDVINNILETLDEDEALRLANLQNNRKSQNADITKMLPPTVNITYPQYGQEISSATITLKYTLQLPNNEPVISVKAYIDGRPVETQKGFKPTGQQQEITVTIPEKDCKVSVIAENKFGFSDPSIVSVVWKGSANTEEILRPKLYLLSIGVSAYNNPDLRLGLAAKDAIDFAAAFASQKGLLYSNVITKVLTDQQATKDNILDALDWIQRETTSRDVAMLYISGHGMNDNAGVFYYLPVNADINAIKRTCLIFADIKTTTMSVAGKVLLFVDACHSGDVMGKNSSRKSPDVTAMVNDLSSAENGVVVFTSSTGRQYSLENASWGNGAFTKALVEGISGKADLFHKGKITVKSLDAYVADRVKELTTGKQSPTAIIPEGVPDFPIAIVK